MAKANAKPTTPEEAAVAVPTKVAGGTETITINSGTVTVKEPKTRHLFEAQELMDGNTKKFMPAIMHLTCRLDGRKLTIEEWEDLPLREGAHLIAELERLGFIA